MISVAPLAGARRPRAAVLPLLKQLPPDATLADCFLTAWGIMLPRVGRRVPVIGRGLVAYLLRTSRNRLILLACRSYANRYGLPRQAARRRWRRLPI